MKAEQIVAPGVKHEDWGFEEAYQGTWAALQAFGVIPHHLCEAPTSRRGGVYFKDEQGRSWRISAFGAHDFRITRRRTARQRAEFESRKLLEEQRISVSKEVEDLSRWSEKRLRDDMRHWVNSFHRMLVATALARPILPLNPEKPNPGRFKYKLTFKEEIDAVFRDLWELVNQAEILEDAAVLTAARQRLGALTDPAFRNFMEKAAGQPSHLR